MLSIVWIRGEIMARMSDFHVVGDPRFAPDVPSGGGGVSKEYVDNADIEVKKTAANGHNDKFDETVIPSQFTNKLYVYGNPESMYHAADVGGEIPAITGGHVSVSYNWWGQQKVGWDQYDFKPYGYDSETDRTFDKLCVVKCVYQADTRSAFYIFLCTCADQYITVIPDRTEPAHTIMYSGIANKLYSQRYSGDPPTPQGYNLETNLGYYTNGIIADFNYENNQYYDFEVSGIPLFVVNSNTQSEFDDVNYYIATGDYSGAVNYSELYPDNPESYVAIDVISGDWYTVVNNEWVKQGTLDLNETGGTEVEANPQGTPTDTLSTISIDGVIYGIEGGGTEVEEKLYDNGTELVSWTVRGGIKNSNNISINVGGGTFTNGTYTTNPIDVTAYTKLKVKYMHNGTTDEKEVDISAYARNRYISFYYLTDSSHNECGIYLSETAGTFASGIVLSSTTRASSNCVLYEMSIIKQGSSSGTSLSDLSDVELTNLSDGQILQYNSTSEKWENADNQGSLPFEFVIDPNDNGINIVYVETDIEFTVKLFEKRVNSSTPDTYTATKDCYVIAINQNINNEASTKTLSSSITTTGEIIDENYYQTSYSSPNRNQSTKLSIIHVSVGDTVILDNPNVSNYSTQCHIVLEVSDFSQIERIISVATADNTYTSAQSYNITNSGYYLAICFQAEASTSGATTYATIETDSTDLQYTILAAEGEPIESISVAIIKDPTIVTFAWGLRNNYVSKGYAIYKLSLGGE